MRNLATKQQAFYSNSNLRKGLFLLIIGSLMALSSAFATGKNPATPIKLTGKVTTEDGTIPGVNVYLKGTQTGTLTNADGTFTFPKEVKSGDILVFSFLGYKTLEYTITSETSAFIEVKLESEAILITGALSDNSKPSGVRKLFAKVKAIF